MSESEHMPVESIQPPAAGPMLAYAPQSPGNRGRPLLVILAGLFTTGLSLAAAAYLSTVFHYIDILAYSVFHIFAPWALLAGLVGASGYLLAARATRTQVNALLLGLILIIQVFTWFAASFCTFCRYVPHLGWIARQPSLYFEFLKAVSSSFVFVNDRGMRTHVSTGEGYFIICVEIISFAGMGMVSAFGNITARCSLCRAPFESRRLALLPASRPYGKIPIHDPVALREFLGDQARLLQEAVDAADQLNELVALDDPATFREVLQPLRANQREVQKLPTRVDIQLVRCASCGRGSIQTVIRIGKRMRLHAQQEVSPRFISELLSQ